MTTSEVADGPTFVLPTNTNPPREEPEEWVVNITESPWRLIGFNDNGIWNNRGQQRHSSTNEELQQQLAMLERVR
jgi:hypothetical protein